MDSKVLRRFLEVDLADQSEDPPLTWPPPDPDRIPVSQNRQLYDHAFTHLDGLMSQQDQIEAFRQRQHEDWKRFDTEASKLARRKPFRKRYQLHGREEDGPSNFLTQTDDSGSGEEGWRDTDGDRLDDFGVDEEAEFYDEDNIPLSELLRRRRETP